MATASTLYLDDGLGNKIPDLTRYHWLVVNSSAGKDSQAMLDYIVAVCDLQGVPHSRIVVVHCDLGRVEWAGTKELAAEQAAHYGLRFEVVGRKGTEHQGRILGDLLEQVWERHQANTRQGKEQEVSPWPNRDNRWCTSDQKTSQVYKLHTRLAAESRKAGVVGPARILDILGMRAEESDKRAQFAPYEHLEKKASSGNKHVDRWLPLHTWTEEQVWDRIWAAGTRWHWAYDKGMERLSCVFCVLAPAHNWDISIEFNRELADAYAEMEQATGHPMVEMAPNKAEKAQSRPGKRISIRSTIDAYDARHAVATPVSLRPSRSESLVA
jgi:3'-phosphoadenosine 5'-phosphosulfate sulfotransferase (PAPS reductase)/FAD synthetase